MTKRTLTSITVKFTDSNTITESDSEFASEIYANYLNGKGFKYDNTDYPYHSIFSVTTTFTTTEEDAPTDTFCTPEN